MSLAKTSKFIIIYSHDWYYLQLTLRMQYTQNNKLNNNYINILIAGGPKKTVHFSFFLNNFYFNENIGLKILYGV